VSDPGRGADAASEPASIPEVGDTYRADEDAPVPTGHYQVVGREAETVTLLHIGDAAGNRRNTGRIESVDRSALDSLEAADAPRVGSFDRTTGAAEVLWLSLRMVPGNLRDRPGQVLLGVALLVAAAVGPAFVDVPTVVLGAANLLGAVLLGFAAAGLPG
jgi:hypothetical protein